MRAKQFTRRVNEGVGDGEVANAVVAEVIKLIGEGHTEVSPDVITTKVSAALGRPFMLKDLVAANNGSPELQHYIDSINPSKIKFSTDILTVKNQDPVKEKERSQAGVSSMASRAASRPRLGEGIDEGINWPKEVPSDASQEQDDEDEPHPYGHDLDEARSDQVHTVNIVKRSSFGGESRTRTTSGTIPELLQYFGYTLETGKSYEHERGRKKINMTPKNINSLVDNLNKAASNAARNGAASTYYSVGEAEVAEGWGGSPGAPDDRTRRERDPDAEYDAMRTAKADDAAIAAQAKRPQTKVYTLTGRGPNMEPNYQFPGEYASQEEASAARDRLMADPKTPNPRMIGISTRTKYLDEYRETPLRDKEDYVAKKKALQDLQADPDTGKDPELSAEVIRRLAGLEKQNKELK